MAPPPKHPPYTLTYGSGSPHALPKVGSRRIFSMRWSPGLPGSEHDSLPNVITAGAAAR